jgi:hypothetical protein
MSFAPVTFRKPLKISWLRQSSGSEKTVVAAKQLATIFGIPSEARDFSLCGSNKKRNSSYLVSLPKNGNFV